VRPSGVSLAPPDLTKKVLEKQQQEAEVQQEPFHVGFMRISETETANVVKVDAAIFSDD
jgi:2-oxo-4-hydroxy-4-carboxy--5-ureidoimidazoline (OHCU) decarboxylase